METAIATDTTPQLPAGKARIAIKWATWAGISLSMLAFFTLVKLPEAKLVNLIQGHLSNRLAAQGITMRPEKSTFSVFMGMKFKMTKVRIYLPPPAKETTLDEIQVSPSFASLLLGRLGAIVYFKSGEGDFTATVAMRGRTKVFLDFKIDSLDLSKLDLVSALTHLKLGAIVDGKGSLSGDMTNLTTFGGSLSLKFNNLLIERQSLVLGGSPFVVPQIGVSETVVDVEGDKGKFKIKTFKLGRADKATDDLVGTISGEANLAARPMDTTLNLQIPQLKASESVRKGLLLDFVAAKYKQSDGTYAGIKLSGPITGLAPAP